MYYDNKKLALSIFWAIFGAVLVGASVAEILDSSLYAGMGGALMAVGVLQAIRNLKYRTDVDYRQKVDVEVTDERNRFLRMKSWSVTGYLVVMIEAVGAVVAFALGQHTIQHILLYSVSVITFVYWLVYVILNRKY